MTNFEAGCERWRNQQLNDYLNQQDALDQAYDAWCEQAIKEMGDTFYKEYEHSIEKRFQTAYNRDWTPYQFAQQCIKDEQDMYYDLVDTWSECPDEFMEKLWERRNVKQAKAVLLRLYGSK